MNQLDKARERKKGGKDDKPPVTGKSAADINAGMSKVPPAKEGLDAAAQELHDRDADVAASQARTGKAGEGKSTAGEQQTMDIVKPSPSALRIIRAILAASDVKKKVSAFEKKLYANLDKQMEIDKVDHLEVDGVPFDRISKSKVKMGAFQDWRPVEDSTTALLKMLGVSAEDFTPPPGE